MLQNKRVLRKSVSSKEVPKWASAYFKCENSLSYVAEFSVKIINHKKTLCIFWYDKKLNCNSHISYIDKCGEAITRTTFKPVKWYTKNPLYADFHNCRYLKNSTETIPKFFNESKELDGVCILDKKITAYKAKISSEKDKIKCQKSRDKWIGLSPLPSRFKRWCEFQASNIIFGTSDNNYGLDRHTGFCTYCNSEVKTSEKMVMGHKYVCPHCGKALTAVPLSKLRFYLCRCFSVLSKLDDNLVVRHYDVSRKISSDLKTTFTFYEYERDIVGRDFKEFHYYTAHTSMYGNEYWRPWKQTKGYHICGMLPNRYYEAEQVYRDNAKKLLSQYKDVINAESIFCVINSTPMRVEEILIADNNRIRATEILYKAGYTSFYEAPLYNEKFSNCNGTTPADIIGLNKEWREYAKKKKFVYSEIELMRTMFSKTQRLRDFAKLYELSVNITKGGYGYYFYYSCRSVFNELINIMQKYSISLSKLYKYYKPLMCNKQDLYKSYGFWKDYLRMYKECIEYGDIEAPSNWRFPSLKSIKKIHDEVTQWHKQIKDKIKAEKRRLYETALKNLVSQLSSIDNYILDGMALKLPNSYDDFVVEGTAQGICVGNGTYFEKMAKGESIIAFLRKKDSPERSYCTVEFKIVDGKALLEQCQLANHINAPAEVNSMAKRYAALLTKQLQQCRIAQVVA